VAGVKSCEPFAERDGVWNAVTEIIEFAKVEMGVRVVLEGAICDGFRAKVGSDGVYGRSGLEFASERVEANITLGNLPT
jgi:hypothetical protein